MGVERQEVAPDLPAGQADLAQGDLQPFGLLDGVGVQQIMDGRVAGDEGQPVGQREVVLRQAALLADADQDWTHVQGSLRLRVVVRLTSTCCGAGSGRLA